MQLNQLTASELEVCIKAIRDERKRRRGALGTIPVGMPDGIRIYNGGQKCDALQGHCVCGAAHGDWEFDKMRARYYALLAD